MISLKPRDPFINADLLKNETAVVGENVTFECWTFGATIIEWVRSNGCIYDDNETSNVTKLKVIHVFDCYSGRKKRFLLKVYLIVVWNSHNT